MASVTGRVQGVSFRAWTQSKARDLGLRGWVRNAPDGSVQALLHGEADSVARMLEALHAGPPAASVATVRHEDADGATVPPGFEIRA